MKFSEIKGKIQNLGDFKSLAEIRDTGLRVVRNTKTGDYWLVEKEFLKPVIKGPQECNSIYVDPESLPTVILSCNKTKKDLEESRILEYVNWGSKRKTKGRQKQETGIRLSEVATVKSRKHWYSIALKTYPDFFCNRFFNERFFFSYSQKILEDQTFYGGLFNYPSEEMKLAQIALLNSSIGYLFTEIYGRIALGEGVLQYAVYEMQNLLAISAKKLNKIRIQTLTQALKKIQNRKINSIFLESGINLSKPIREQEPNPLPDRKALDDIVFDALGLTKEERKEVYWAVCELVKNRLEKAKSV